jgi:hypothetical protein
MNHEQYAGDYYRAKRNWELSLAREFLEAEGKNRDEREAKALLKLMHHDDYKKFVVAEANWEGSKAVMRVLETRASVGQSLLRVIAQETR